MLQCNEGKDPRSFHHSSEELIDVTSARKCAFIAILALHLCLASGLAFVEAGDIVVSSATSRGTPGDDGKVRYVFELRAGPGNLISEYIFDPDNGEPVQSKAWGETVQFFATYFDDGLRHEPSITAVGRDPSDNVRTGYVIEYDQDGLTAGGSTGCDMGIFGILGLLLASPLAASGKKKRDR